MKPWSIRRARPADADALAACLDAAYAQYADRLAELPRMSDGCAEDIARFDVWVAETGGRVVGGLVLMREDGFMRLANVAVHPDARGTGLGRTLIRLAEAEAQALGFREMRLNTHEAMPENIRLYTRLGWEEIGHRGITVSMRKSFQA